MILRLMSYNIHFGGRGREERIAEVIRHCDPDIVVLQEATRTDIVGRLAELTHMEHHAARRDYSTAFLSRVEVESYAWHRPPGLQRAYIEIKLAGTSTVIFGVHLRATHSNLTERQRMREARALLKSIKEHREGFRLLAGDFNTLAPGELLEMRRLPWRYRLLAMVLGGRVTYRTIQIMLDAGYLDAYRRFHTKPGFTFPAWNPHVRLDYVFVPSKYADRVRSCDVITGIPNLARATDHLPLVAEIAID
jgi:endonuclease/exonuclease/phosphatase family metal-dependent hydrolase